MSAPGWTCITVIGAECTGKTTLADALGRRLGAPVVPEAARLFVEREARPVRRGDEPGIVALHLAERAKAEAGAIDSRARYLVFDTDLLSTVIYARHYQGSCPPSIVRKAAALRADLYLVTEPDFPFEADDFQRGSAEDRRAVHELLLDALRRRKWPFVQITGSATARVDEALRAIDGL